MLFKPKKLEDQVVVVTGASSGIGLATAKMAAERGARVVLVARDEDGLRRAVEEIEAEGGQALYMLADVAEAGELREVAETVARDLGRFDTWVNNAGVSIYGRAEEVPLEDARRLFDVNYWGIVHGSVAALPHLREHGGALINVGSIVSDRAIPLQGHYSASKHAVKAFTDALRMELEEEGAPVAVTLIKPASIDTPFPEHARDYMEAEPKLPAPVYAPEAVARAILACARKPRRDVVVGGGGRMITALGHLAPRLTDRYMEAALFRAQKADRATRPGREDALYDPQPGGEHGDHPGHVMKSSLYTKAAMRPGLALLGLAAAGLTMAFATGKGPFRRGAREMDAEPSAALGFPG